jgi:transposase
MSQSKKVYLTDNERNYLKDLVSKEHCCQRLLQRANILLMADRTNGKWNRYKKIAESLYSSSSTVSSVCRQYVKYGLATALRGKPKFGRVIKTTKEVEDHLILLIQSKPPKDQRRWTLKLLADQLIKLGLVESISGVSVHKRLKKLGLKIRKSEN